MFRTSGRRVLKTQGTDHSSHKGWPFLRRPLVVLSAVACLAGFTVLPVRAGASTPSCETPPGSFNPANGSSADLTRYCYVVTSPSKEETLPDGGTATTIGSDTFFAPPAGFDPTKATDGQLAEYGFPKRPDTGSDQYDAWLNAMSHYKYTVPVKHLFHRSVGARGSAAISSTSNNWGGYMANSYVQEYDLSNGTFTQPSVTHLCNASTWLNWVGLGGWNSGNLIQAGIGSSSQSAGLTNALNNPYNSSGGQAWYQDTSTSNLWTTVPNFFTYPGDSVYVSASHDSGNPVWYYISDLTTGQGISIGHWPNAVDHSTAEAIVERAIIYSSDGSTSGYGSLGAFTGYGWSQAGTYSTVAHHAYGIGGAPYSWALQMKNTTTYSWPGVRSNTGDVLAQEGNLNNNLLSAQSSFSETWVNCD